VTQELTIFDEHLDITYDRSTAPSMRRFLTTLRDDGDVVASDCDCGHTHVPPRDVCPSCGANVDEFTALDPVGHLLTWTSSPAPEDAPFEGEVTYGVVRLEDAEGGLLHVVDVPGEGSPEASELEPGARVEARLRDEEDREGSILDIECFEVVE
jgi:uncharacterized OB-fold protein